MLCGPVIGNVTHDTAIVLLEVDMNCIITCKLTKSDGNAIVTSELSLQMTAKVPKVIHSSLKLIYNSRHSILRIFFQTQTTVFPLKGLPVAILTQDH